MVDQAHLNVLLKSDDQLLRRRLKVDRFVYFNAGLFFQSFGLFFKLISFAFPLVFPERFNLIFKLFGFIDKYFGMVPEFKSFLF